jgi:hypothetical protein
MEMERMKTRHSIHIVLCFASAATGARLAAEEAETETRSYDLSAVVGEVRNAPFILRPTGSLVPIFEQREQDSLFGDEDDRTPLPPESEQAQLLAEAFNATKSAVLDRETIQQRVIDALASAGAETADVGGTISWSGNVLTVRAPAAALAAVERALAPVLAVASYLVSVDCLLVPLEVLDGLAPGWRSDPNALPRDVFAKALLDGRSRLLSVAARNGQRTATGSRNIKAMVTDQEVNQTGVIPVVNPVVEASLSGDRLEVRPVVLSGREALWLDLVVGRVRTGAERKDLGGDWGELELPESRETLISTTLIAASGTPIVAGVIEDRQGLAAIVRAELRPAARPLQGQGAQGTSFAFRDARILLEKRPARRWPSWNVQDRLSPAEPRFGDRNVLAESLRQRSGSPDEEAQLEVLFGGYVDFRGPEEIQKRLVTALEQEIAAAAKVVSVDIDILAVSRVGLSTAREAAEGGFLLAADWRKALGPKDILGERRCAVTGVAGQVHALRQATIRNYVADVNQVSGGTGFAIVMMSDPEVQTCGDGLEIRILAEPLPGGGAARVRIEGATSRILEERPFTVTFPVIPHLTGTDSSSEATGRPTEAKEVRKTLSLTLPHLSVDYWSEEVQAPLDRDVILHASAPEGDTASLLIGRVRVMR